jgi:aliphatic nitrilase
MKSSRTITVAAAHLASVMLDKSACIAKACRFIDEAAASGARLVVFPESFIPGFPLWNAYLPPIEGHALFRRLAENSVLVPGTDLAPIRQAATRNRIHVSVGLSEVSAVSAGCLWNTNLLIGETGEILNHHRKLMPTFHEKLSWSHGDGAGLRVVSTPIGRIGSLICGENNNPLARYALIAQGEQIHTASFAPPWSFRAPAPDAAPYDLGESIRFRTASLSFEGKVFTVVSAGFLDDESIEIASGGTGEAKEILRKAPPTCSMIVGPNGELRSRVLSDQEGLVYAEIDLDESIELKRHHDLTGYYNRFDVFQFNVNRTRHSPLSLRSDHEHRPVAAEGRHAGNPHAPGDPEPDRRNAD